MKTGVLICLLYALGASLPVARAQFVEPDLGTLSPQELLLDPSRLEAGEGGILERWAMIMQFVEHRVEPRQRGIAAAALARALLQDLGWQKARDYAETIPDSVWRAHALLSIASRQFESHNGRRFGLETLDQALAVLQALPESALGVEGIEAYRQAGVLFAKYGFFDLLVRQSREESRPLARASFLKGALPILTSPLTPSATTQSLEDREGFLSELIGQLGRVTKPSLELLLLLSDVARQSGDTKGSNRLLFEAYRTLATLPLGQERDTTLQRVIRHWLANGAFSQALRATRRISDPFRQSTLLAEAGRAMVQAGRVSAGQTLLALAHDIARDLDPPKRREALLRIVIERALAGELAEAWETAQDLEGAFERARGTLAIAFVLGENGETERALDLLDDIGYANLRARLITHLAEPISEQLSAEKLSEMLLTLLDLETFSAPYPTWSQANIGRILEAQLQYGKSRKNKELFPRVAEIVDSTTQSDFMRLQTRLLLLGFEALRSPRHAERAAREVESILRELWSYRSTPDYARSVASAARFFFDQGNMERAFTIAASLLRETPETIALRDALLSDIARASQTRANEDLALRALAEISVERDKSRALAAVIDIAADLPRVSTSSKSTTQ